MQYGTSQQVADRVKSALKGAIANLNLSWLLQGFVLGCLILSPAPANARPTAANDGTNTRVTAEGDRFDISGGTRSGDRANLFHSFEQFDLDADQIANFLSNPEIQNILGRVVGGDASFIDGLIQVTGGNSNLYLMNPAGIVFGPNSSLNVPADFTATTADGIGFDTMWFDAIGDNDYSDLIGTPDGYRFSTFSPGSVVNAGTLAVPEGASLTLLGGTVINTGTLTAPGGTITVAAVPGENYVRVQQEGMLLALDIETLDGSETASLPFTPRTLPALLTGEAIANATNIQVNANGTVSLMGSGLSAPTAPGTALVTGNLSTSSNAPSRSPEINILGNHIALLDANLDASGRPGGTIRVGGDYQGQGAIPNAQFTYVDANTSLNADGLGSGASGDGGRIIVWADDTTQFYGELAAQGSGTGAGGFAEVSGQNSLVFAGTADLTAPSGNTGTLLLDPTNITIVNGNGGANDNPVQDGEIVTGDRPNASLTISENTLENLSSTANVSLEASNLIKINDLSDDVLNLSNLNTLRFTSDSFEMDSSDTINVSNGTLVIDAPNVLLGSIEANRFRVEASTIDFLESSSITANAIRFFPHNTDQELTIRSNENLVEMNGSLIVDGGDTNNSISLVNTSLDIDGSVLFNFTGADRFTLNNVEINATGPFLARSLRLSQPTQIEGDTSISAQNIDFRFRREGIDILNGAQLELNSQRNIAIGNISVDGSLFLSTGSGRIRVEEVDGSGPQGSNITLNSGTRIRAGNIVSEGFSGDGGNIRLEARDKIRFSTINTQSNGSGRGGDIEVIAGRFVQGTGRVSAQNGESVTILADGGGGGGNVFIEHGGGERNPPVANFSVGRVGQNGIAEGVSSGNSQIIPPFQPLGLTEVGNITISTDVVFSDVTNDLDSTFNGLDTPSLSNSREGTLDTGIEETESQFSNAFTEHFGLPAQPALSLSDIRDRLTGLEQQTGYRSALIYIKFESRRIPQISAGSHSVLSNETSIDAAPNPPETETVSPSDSEKVLEIFMVSSTGRVTQRTVVGVTSEEVLEAAAAFRRRLLSPAERLQPRYLEQSEQLYNWLIAPLEAELENQDIDNLLLSLDSGLRSLPLGALYDGEHFLIENYSVGLIPSFNLTDTRYQPLQNSQVLAMGISEFTELNPLPAVTVEVPTIASQIWQGDAFLNDEFTFENLRQQRNQTPYRIVHLATHASFRAGELSNSYIQLWDSQLRLDQLQQLGWRNNENPVDLVVLSACQTA
ncbi:MAG: CHAT domain-containing protein, partial [Elainellaceae cyanobacterium]